MGDFCMQSRIGLVKTFQFFLQICLRPVVILPSTCRTPDQKKKKKKDFKKKIGNHLVL